MGIATLSDKKHDELKLRTYKTSIAALAVFAVILSLITIYYWNPIAESITNMLYILIVLHSIFAVGFVVAYVEVSEHPAEKRSLKRLLYLYDQLREAYESAEPDLDFLSSRFYNLLNYLMNIYTKEPDPSKRDRAFNITNIVKSINEPLAASRDFLTNNDNIVDIITNLEDMTDIPLDRIKSAIEGAKSVGEDVLKSIPQRARSRNALFLKKNATDAVSTSHQLEDLLNPNITKLDRLIRQFRTEAELISKEMPLFTKKNLENASLISLITLFPSLNAIFFVNATKLHVLLELIYVNFAIFFSIYGIFRKVKKDEE